jgi:hypothetical protein
LAPAPDTRTYGNAIQADKSTVWPLKNPKVTYVKGKVSGVQLVGNKNETVNCIMAGTVMYVGVYRGFGQVLFVQSQTGLIYAYTGLGYGYRGIFGQTVNGKWVKYFNNSTVYNGVVFEIGLMGNIKGFAISAGYSMIANDDAYFPEAKIGIGYCF